MIVPGLSSALTAVTDNESSAPGTGELDARSRRAQQRRDSNRGRSGIPAFAAAQPAHPCAVVRPSPFRLSRESAAIRCHILWQIARESCLIDHSPPGDDLLFGAAAPSPSAGVPLRVGLLINACSYSLYIECLNPFFLSVYQRFKFGHFRHRCSPSVGLIEFPCTRRRAADGVRLIRELLST
jgi:hypothetical protein